MIVLLIDKFEELCKPIYNWLYSKKQKISNGVLSKIFEWPDEESKDEKEDSTCSQTKAKSLVKRKRNSENDGQKFLLTSQIRPSSSTQNPSKLQLSINRWEKETNSKVKEEIQAGYKKKAPAKEVKRIKKELKKAQSDTSSIGNSDDDDYGFFDDDIPNEKKKKKNNKKALI